jgi:hypothetical protein
VGKAAGHFVTSHLVSFLNQSVFLLVDTVPIMVHFCGAPVVEHGDAKVAERGDS